MKVVCVDASHISGVNFVPGAWDASEAPKVGAIYTISRIWVDTEGYPVCEFVELKRSEWSHRFYGKHVGYFVGRFRPVETRKTDISVFTAMLHGTDHTVDA
jgi:hypothetical protein